MAAAKKDIRALNLEELQEFFVAQGDKAFRAKQVYQWLWNKGIHDFEDDQFVEIYTCTTGRTFYH